jgi:hypothetical protein
MNIRQIHDTGTSMPARTRVEDRDKSLCSAMDDTFKPSPFESDFPSTETSGGGKGLSLLQGGPPGNRTAASVLLDGSARPISSLWEYKTKGALHSSPCIGQEETIYVGSTDFSLHANRGGRTLWEFETGGMVYSSPVEGPDGTVYAGSYTPHGIN